MKDIKRYYSIPISPIMSIHCMEYIPYPGLKSVNKGECKVLVTALLEIVGIGRFGGIYIVQFHDGINVMSENDHVQSYAFTNTFLFKLITNHVIEAYKTTDYNNSIVDIPYLQSISIRGRTLSVTSTMPKIFGVRDCECMSSNGYSTGNCLRCRRETRSHSGEIASMIFSIGGLIEFTASITYKSKSCNATLKLNDDILKYRIIDLDKDAKEFIYHRILASYFGFSFTREYIIKVDKK